MIPTTKYLVPFEIMQSEILTAKNGKGSTEQKMRKSQVHFYFGFVFTVYLAHSSIISFFLLWFPIYREIWVNV